ncbi:MAG: hypothetical protein KAT68_07505 [Bacteroidales bacterium]|nr:hypothetical protein [Bacteroidales bacterium]
MKTLTLILALCIAVLLLGQTPVIAQYNTENVKKIKCQNALYEYMKPAVPAHKLYINFHLNNHPKALCELKQKMDSIINEEWNESVKQWENDNKEEFKYDSKGNNILWNNLEWNHQPVAKLMENRNWV